MRTVVIIPALAALAQMARDVDDEETAYWFERSARVPALATSGPARFDELAGDAAR